MYEQVTFVPVLCFSQLLTIGIIYLLVLHTPYVYAVCGKTCSPLTPSLRATLLPGGFYHCNKNVNEYYTCKAQLAVACVPPIRIALL